MASDSHYTIVAFYHFTRFDELHKFRASLQKLCDEHTVKGSILLAHEGINGTIAGKAFGIDAVLHALKALPDCHALEYKMSFADHNPFLRMKVKLKREIVTMGQADINPRASVGHYVDAENWNALITQDDVITIDTRNAYEVEIGTFKGAVNPKTESFRDFPEWWQKNKEKFQNKRIAMFCTGGIRCEKSTNYLLNQGVKDVYHLKGGILKYLEDIPQENSEWEGECFVFDARVSVKHGVLEGDYELCYACRMPLKPQDFERPEFEKGVSCHRCINTHDEDRRLRFRERQKQILLAEARGEQHIGDSQ